MEQVYNGVCGNCDCQFNLVVENTPGDDIPDTCPFCGSSAEYNEIDDQDVE